MPLGIASNNEQKVKVTAQPTTSSGKPASLDGPLRVTVQSGEGTFTQDAAEPNSFFAVSGDNPGTTEYLVEGDADLGTDETLIQDVITYEVSGAQAANFGLVAGTPEPK
jgi:hypothetical protein